MNLDVKTGSYNRLLDQQRVYFKTVKAFQDECVKNEQLMAMIQVIFQISGGVGSFSAFAVWGAKSDMFVVSCV